MARLGRRHFVKGSLGAAGAAALFSNLFARRASASSYGDLVPDPEGILDLPEGFSYVILQTAGDDMSDGYVVPARGDGMACFEGADGNWSLMRNHEISAGDEASGAYGADAVPKEAYDPDGYGGVTRVVIDPATGEVISSNLVLAGTVRNCAGGPSPWGWLSCEENVEDNHGYVFACPENAEGLIQAEPIIGFGRFNHEAAAVDPATLVTYLTEDRGDGCFYRHVPDSKNMPFEGTLQALRIVDTDAFETAPLGKVGETFDIEWVDIENPNPDDDSMRYAAQASGASVFIRGEGLWFFDGEVYFSCTNGGPTGLGQIFRVIDNGDTGTLELIAVSESGNVLDFPDNITVAPWGQLFIAEDGSGEQFVRFIDADGSICDFARNAVSDSELAGVCFSPDGTAMFVNIQEDGLTLMVTGPFTDDGGESTGSSSSGGSDDTDGDSDSDSDASTSDSASDSDATETSPTTDPGDGSSGTADTDTDSAGGGSGGGGGCNVDGGNATAAVGLGAVVFAKAVLSSPLEQEDE
jgi:secreted PhoX family phosphatase